LFVFQIQTTFTKILIILFKPLNSRSSHKYKFLLYC